jgi:hypothetical protein
MKSTDLSDEYHAENGIRIPFSDWMDENECIKGETVEQFQELIRGRCSIIISYVIILLL